MSHTESSLKALTVPKLKELLSAADLVQTGKKDELIARLLEAPPATSAAPVSTTAAESVATPSSVPVASTSAPVAALPATTPTASTSEASAAPVEPVKVELTAEQKALAAKAEEEKRKARAARFGVVEETKVGDALSKRAERFGLQGADEAVTKSLAALDQPLGAKAGRPVKVPKAKVAVPTTAAKVPVVAAVAKPVDPELQKKMAEEEEKRKKRAAKYGTGSDEQPVEKKAKVVV